MRLEELKEWANDPNRYAHWMTYHKDVMVELAPKILAVLEAAIQAENDSQTEELGHLIQLPQEFTNAIEAFSAALEKL